MATFGPEIAAEVATACAAGAGEASQAFSRSLDGALTLAFESTGVFSAAECPTGPALAIALKTDAGAAVVVIPESTGLLPAWYGAPDPTGVSKLATLGQELGMLLLPEAYMAMDFAAGKVAEIPVALTRGGVVDGAALAKLTLSGSAGPQAIFMVWPVPQPDDALKEPKPETPKAAPKAPAVVPKPTAVEPGPDDERDFEDSLPELPPYTRSLLRIKVSVSVTLAKSTQPVSRIVELGPGSILQFDKPCEEPLTLCVGDHEVARGEAVKAGEKFGLRITEMILPGERFVAVGKVRG